MFGEAMLVREPPAAARPPAGAAAGAGSPAVLAAAAGRRGCWRARSRRAGGRAAGPALAAYEQAAGRLPLDPVADGDLRPLVALLDQARALATACRRAAGSALGLCQGAKLQAGARAVYRDGLAYGLLPRLLWRLEAQMRGSLGRPDTLYEPPAST